MTTNRPPKTFSIAAQIAGLRAAGAGSNPMVFDDYRRPMRAAMLRDARAAMLNNAGAPWSVVDRLSRLPLAEWPPVARETLRLRGAHPSGFRG